ncbi:MAG: hypothetical protein ACKOOF_04835 [Planctomycetaceae bacterium]
MDVPLVQISGLIEPLPHYDLTAMQSLVDIEQAVQNLSAEQQAELLLFVAERLRSQRVPLPEPREFSPEQLKAWLDEDEQAMDRFRSGS